MADALSLPPLREDLRLLAGPSTAHGAPSWTLYDQATHRFFRIGWSEFEILSRWGLDNPDAIAHAVSEQTTLDVSTSDVLAVVRFCEDAGVTRAEGEKGLKRRAAVLAGGRVSAAKWLLKNYLFLRIRLVDPDCVLGALAHRMGWAFHPAFPAVLGLLAALGLYLIGREWERFTHTLSWAFTLEGALVAGVALSLAKVAHEVGHGLAAKHFGCRVPAMGVALMVLWPVLWTDVTDAWKLIDRRKRLVIDAAGMVAEITVAVAASLVWTVLPDGPVRAAVFLLAGTTWILTLAVNLNPLMRFDGYFLLADLLDEPNLQDRSFALARWWLRERLFGLGDPAPENLPGSRRSLLVTYALATWIYRFFLFLGIALLVYHLAFKALGLFLMGVEIAWFILRPISSEISAWRKRRSDMRWNRNLAVTASLAALAVMASLVPWSGSLTIPALMRPERQTPLYTVAAGRLSALSQEGQAVEEGASLFVLEAPEVEYRRRRAQAEIDGLRGHLAGLAFDGTGAADLTVVWEELGKAVAERNDADAAIRTLTTRAAFAGKVVDVPPVLHEGLWMGKHEPLGLLIDPQVWIIEAYVDEADLGRLETGTAASFYSENGDVVRDARLTAVDHHSTRELAAPVLASTHGGAIPVRPDSEGRLIPETSLYRVLLAVNEGGSVPPADGLRRGTVVLDAKAESFILRLWRKAVSVIIRESNL